MSSMIANELAQDPEITQRISDNLAEILSDLGEIGQSFKVTVDQLKVGHLERNIELLEKVKESVSTMGSNCIRLSHEVKDIRESQDKVLKEVARLNESYQEARKSFGELKASLKGNDQ